MRCWGENKNVHPKYGTDVASVVPPNLGCLYASLTQVVPGWFDALILSFQRTLRNNGRKSRLQLLDDWIAFTLRLGGPFRIEFPRRSRSHSNLLSGATSNAYSSSSQPFEFR